ncbi:MAG: hypothetical protein QOK42_887 [Frankiaceae bacterium]|jgi:hypothetical protein|nr:hypothetical protein [Frankiaceae bacterium]
MTEQALLPGAVEVDGSKSNSRVLLVAMGAGVLALLVAVYFLFFTGSGTDQALSSQQLPAPHSKVIKKTTHKTTAKKPAAAVVPATFTGVHSKDPFKPLLNPPPPPPPSAAPVAGGGSTAPAQVVGLSSVGFSTVTVTVNGVVYKPKVGSSFATYFKLLRLQGPSCATFLYGDESFDLCKGSTTTKQ